jgi:hypothetical protein
MSNSAKRESITLSANVKIIKKLDKGENNLTKEYGAGCTTIYGIRKNKEKIECFVKSSVRSIHKQKTEKY